MAPHCQYHLQVEANDFAHFFKYGTKLNIPYEIQPPLTAAQTSQLWCDSIRKLWYHNFLR